MNPHSKGYSFAIMSVFLLPAISQAQDALADLPSVPMGFSEVPTAISTFSDSDGGNRNLNLSGALTLEYNSNVNQGVAGQGGSAEGDFTISPSVALSYLRRRELWQFGARANASYRYFVENDDLNAFNGAIGVFGGYQSTKLVASLSSNISSSSGVNRLSGGFLEQFSLSTALMATYRFTGKTSLSASWNYLKTENQTSGFQDVSSSNFNLSALWQATPFLNVGPGVRYGVRDGRDGDLTTVGPSLLVNYDLSNRVRLRSSIGLGFNELPSGDTQELMNWSVSLNYTPSQLWGLRLTMRQDSQATFLDGGGFDESTSYQLSFNRSIRSARLGLFFSYQERDPIEFDTAPNSGRDSEFYSLGGSFTFPVFRDRARFSTNISWREQSASTDEFSFDGFQYRASLSWQF